MIRDQLLRKAGVLQGFEFSCLGDEVRSRFQFASGTYIRPKPWNLHNHFALQDKAVKERIDARNKLETYLYNMKNTVEDKMKDKVRQPSCLPCVDFLPFCLGASLEGERWAACQPPNLECITLHEVLLRNEIKKVFLM